MYPIQETELALHDLVNHWVKHRDDRATASDLVSELLRRFWLGELPLRAPLRDKPWDRRELLALLRTTLPPDDLEPLFAPENEPVERVRVRVSAAGPAAGRSERVERGRARRSLCRPGPTAQRGVHAARDSGAHRLSRAPRRFRGAVRAAGLASAAVLVSDGLAQPRCAGQARRRAWLPALGRECLKNNVTFENKHAWREEARRRFPI